jgi:hypothetical protein
MKATDLHWAAGFLEGEGCFTPINKKHARISVSQKNEEPLLKLQALMGGSIKPLTRVRPMLVGGRIVQQESSILRWTLNGLAAKPFLEKLLPLMSVKRQGQMKTSLGGTS